MTIKQIKSILPAPTIVTLDEFQDKTFAIDTSIFLYKYKYFKPEGFEFIEGFKMMFKQFKKNGIKPIFIFDGKPPALKQSILDSRQKRKDTSEKAIRITKEDVAALQDYFQENEIEFLKADGEAEKECCRFELQGKADYVLSNDFDTFLFGAEKLIRCNKNIYELYTWQSISENLGLSRDEFKLLAISIGFDYLPSGIKGFGPKKSLDYIKKHGQLPKNDISQDLLKQIYDEFK